MAVRHGRSVPTAAAALAAMVLLFLAGRLYADEQIAQVDPSHLLTEQKVDVYVSVTGPAGRPVEGLSAADFRMSEGAPGGELLPVRSFTLHEGADTGEGITFFLLVDNSGSMYETTPGGQTRIAAAEQAIRTFINSVTNPADRTGLATFSTYYRPEVLPNRDRSSVESALSNIKRPAAQGAYTELYASLRSAARDLAGWKGRKVVILLTDGENYPYKVHTGRPSPQFGDEVASSDQAVQAMVREGISVFPIHFGPAREDANLQKIARDTGGRVFEAGSESELEGVYLDVRSRVLKEYRLTYSPRLIAGDRRVVQVDYTGPGGPDSAQQVYFVGTLFGGSGEPVSALLLVPVAIALVGWYLLSRLRFVNRRSEPNLEVLGAGRTQVFALGDDRTIVRAAPKEGITIAGHKEGEDVPGAEGDITIARDTGGFTVQSSEPVMVNNRPQRRRKLQPGDVIRVGDVTVVFDQPPRKGGDKGESGQS